MLNGKSPVRKTGPVNETGNAKHCNRTPRTHNNVGTGVMEEIDLKL